LSLTIDIIKNSVKYSALISAIIGTLYFSKYKKTSIKYFLYLLWYITITEFLGPYLTENNFLTFKDENGIKYNLWIYNLLEIVTFITLMYIYFKSIINSKYRNWIKIFCSSYIGVSILNWLLLQNFLREWSELPYVYGSIVIIVIIIFYFIELLQSEKLIQFHKILLFWISIGLLLFHTGVIPFSIKINGYALIPGVHKLFLIVYVLAITMYLTFTFGFIWSKKE